MADNKIEGDVKGNPIADPVPDSAAVKIDTAEKVIDDNLKQVWRVVERIGKHAKRFGEEMGVSVVNPRLKERLPQGDLSVNVFINGDAQPPVERKIDDYYASMDVRVERLFLARRKQGDCVRRSRQEIAISPANIYQEGCYVRVYLNGEDSLPVIGKVNNLDSAINTRIKETRRKILGL